MIQEDYHPFFVFQDERVDDLHVALLNTELHQVGQVLEALGYHDQRPGGRGGRGVRDKVELPGVQDGGAEEAEEDEAGDGPGLDQTLVGPFLKHVSLEAVANVPKVKEERRSRCESHLWKFSNV